MATTWVRRAWPQLNYKMLLCHEASRKALTSNSLVYGAPVCGAWILGGCAAWAAIGSVQSTDEESGLVVRGISDMREVDLRGTIPVEASIEPEADPMGAKWDDLQVTPPRITGGGPGGAGVSITYRTSAALAARKNGERASRSAKFSVTRASICP